MLIIQNKILSSEINMKRVKLNKASLFTLIIVFTPFFTLSIIFPIKTSSELYDNKSINNLINLSSEDPEFPWTSNGIPIYAGGGSQQYPQLCSDGKGGAIFVWQDSRGGTLTDVYAQKINSAGVVQWPYEGVLICTTSEEHQEPQICSDGNGGAIIAWEDSRSRDIYAQRVNSSGDVQWAANGIPICTGLWLKEDPRVCSDENGGAIITWVDNRGGASNYQVYTQRINPIGNVQWTPNGELISQSGLTNIMSQITGDGKGGAFITWLDSVNWDIYIQYISINGILQWIGDKPVCTEINPQFYNQICSDGNGGAFIAWQDRRSGITIYSQMIDSAGIMHWTPNGTLISTTASSSSRPELCNDGDGGVLITWEDNGIYTQRVNSSGSVLWTVDGIAICIGTGAHQDPQITSDKNGGCFITWEDTRNGDFDIYAQLVNSTGDVQWTTNGFPICTVINDQASPQICSGGKGSAIIVWFDSRFEWGTYDIFAQMVKEKVSIIIVKQMQFEIADQSFSTDYFNMTFFIHNETHQGVDFAMIQIWWNGIDVSDDVQNLGNGFYFVSLEAILVEIGEDPILLNMTVSATGYENKYFETYIAIDPDALQKDVGAPSEKIPLPIIITISIVSVGAILGLAGIFWYKRRGKEIS